MSLPPSDQLSRFVSRAQELAEGKLQNQFVQSVVQETAELIVFAESQQRKFELLAAFLEERLNILENTESTAFNHGKKAAYQAIQCVLQRNGELSVLAWGDMGKKNTKFPNG